MQNLRQKAHISLREFREGRLSPVAGNISYKMFHEGSPELEEDDELSKLGGKTRLISQKEQSKSPSPLLVTRSPNTHNPVVPLPLAEGSTEVHPSVFEYLSSFGRPGQAQQDPRVFGTQQGPGMYRSYENEGANASAMHFNPNVELQSPGVLPTPTSASSSTSQNLVLPSPHGQGHGASSNAGGSGASGQQQQQQQNYFPQYFPVFDYGTAAGSSSNGYTQMQLAAANTAGFEQDHSMVPYEDVPATNGGVGISGASGMNGMNGIDTRSYANANGMQTSEASMHTTWLDFVRQMSMNG